MKFLYLPNSAPMFATSARIVAIGNEYRESDKSVRIMVELEGAQLQMNGSPFVYTIPTQVGWRQLKPLDAEADDILKAAHAASVLTNELRSEK